MKSIDEKFKAITDCISGPVPPPLYRLRECPRCQEVDARANKTELRSFVVVIVSWGIMLVLMAGMWLANLPCMHS